MQNQSQLSIFRETSELNYRRDFEQITGDSNSASILFRHLALIQGKPDPEEGSDKEEEDDEVEVILGIHASGSQTSSSQNDEKEAPKPNIIGKFFSHKIQICAS